MNLLSYTNLLLVMREIKQHTKENSIVYIYIYINIYLLNFLSQKIVNNKIK